MLEVFVYKDRDNPVVVELRAEARTEDDPTPAPPLEDATKVTLKTSNGLSLDTDNDPDAIEIIDTTRLRMVLGPEFATKDEGLDGFLSVFYLNTPNGIAWPGSREDPDLPTFRFIPVAWPE